MVWQPNQNKQCACVLSHSLLPLSPTVSLTLFKDCRIFMKLSVTLEKKRSVGQIEWSVQVVLVVVFQALQAPACHENMVKVGGYILGEFGNLIAGDPRSRWGGVCLSVCVCVCVCVWCFCIHACASLLQQRIFLRKVHIVCLEEGQLWKLYYQCSNAILMLCVFFSAPWYSSSCFIPSTTCAVPTLVACCCQHISSLSTCSQRSS